LLIKELIKNGKLVRFLGGKGIRQGIIGPRIVKATSPRSSSLRIIIHETVLNKMRRIKRIIPGRIWKEKRIEEAGVHGVETGQHAIIAEIR
jgi:hypothetical protein